MRLGRIEIALDAAHRARTCPRPPWATRIGSLVLVAVAVVAVLVLLTSVVWVLVK
jgi:hypothetical protein